DRAGGRIRLLPLVDRAGLEVHAAMLVVASQRPVATAALNGARRLLMMEGLRQRRAGMFSDRASWLGRCARAGAISAAAAAAALIAAAAVAAQPPPTLTSEFLVADQLAGSGSLNVMASCNPLGTS